LLFAELILFYALCDISLSAEKGIYFSHGLNHTVSTVVTTFYNYLYLMIMPLQLCCLVERLIATLCFHSYEKCRKWYLLALSQPFCIGFVFFVDYGIIALLCINRRLTKKYTGAGVSLSTRYQLTENIRTLRVFLPMIGFDTVISLVDTLGGYFRLRQVFDPERCASDPPYLALYISITMVRRMIIDILPAIQYRSPIQYSSFECLESSAVSSGLELSESIVVVCRYPNTARILCGCLSSSSSKVTTKGPRPIINVFGSDLITQQQNSRHFDDLKKSWRQ
ncbi:hypothetical protein COOONC_02976, partial [Cooperia oncophora]